MNHFDIFDYNIYARDCIMDKIRKLENIFKAQLYALYDLTTQVQYSSHVCSLNFRQLTSGRMIILFLFIFLYIYYIITGVTQEEIDDKRLETERRMLADLKRLAGDKGNLEYRDKNWATPVCTTHTHVYKVHIFITSSYLINVST